MYSKFKEHVNLGGNKNVSKNQDVAHDTMFFIDLM